MASDTPEEVTIQVKIEMDIDIDEEGSADLLQDLLEGMMDDSIEENTKDGVLKLQPAIVYSDCPYAPLVEFGTLPRENQLDPNSAETVERMRNWVAKRIRTAPDENRMRKLTMAFIDKINKEGTAPSPAVRSSIDLIMREIGGGEGNATSFIDEGGTILEIAEKLCKKIKDVFEYNGMEITGVLKDSYKFEPISNWSIVGGEVVVDGQDTNGADLPESVWEDSSLGKGGKRPTKYWRSP